MCFHLDTNLCKHLKNGFHYYKTLSAIANKWFRRNKENQFVRASNLAEFQAIPMLYNADLIKNLFYKISSVKIMMAFVLSFSMPSTDIKH